MFYFAWYWCLTSSASYSILIKLECSLHVSESGSHAHTKHIELGYHFVRQNLALILLVARFVSSIGLLINIFTKPLSQYLFWSFFTILVFNFSHAWVIKETDMLNSKIPWSLREFPTQKDLLYSSVFYFKHNNLSCFSEFPFLLKLSSNQVYILRDLLYSHFFFFWELEFPKIVVRFFMIKWLGTNENQRTESQCF